MEVKHSTKNNEKDELIKGQLKIRDRVRAIMKADRESRNSDRRLNLKYLECYFGVKVSPEVEEALLKLPTKSIINERQYIQNIERKYRPTRRAVRIVREKMSQAVREAHRRSTNG